MNQTGVWEVMVDVNWSDRAIVGVWRKWTLDSYRCGSL